MLSLSWLLEMLSTNKFWSLLTNSCTRTKHLKCISMKSREVWKVEASFKSLVSGKQCSAIVKLPYSSCKHSFFVITTTPLSPIPYFCHLLLLWSISTSIPQTMPDQSDPVNILNSPQFPWFNFKQDSESSKLLIHPDWGFCSHKKASHFAPTLQ